MRSLSCGITLPQRLYVAGLAREEDQHVDVELDRVAADLHVALFEDVEQADLHQLVELGQLVHGEDAAVHARDQAEVQGLLGRHARAAGQLGRVDLADDVGELGARARAARRSGRRAATRRSALRRPARSATSCLPALRDRPIRIFVDRAVRDRRGRESRRRGTAPAAASAGSWPAPSRRGTAGRARRAGRC